MSEYYKKDGFFLKIKGTKILGVCDSGIETDELDEPKTREELLSSLEVSTKSDFDEAYIRVANNINEMIKD